MNIPEWHDLTALAVSLVALIVAGIAATNQLASLKRPLPSVDFMYGERLTVNLGPNFDKRETVVAATVIVRITNRGHETMYHPTLYDWTPHSTHFEDPSLKPLPSALGPSEIVARPINYTLANRHERIIGLVWEEASLFGRTPKTMGIRFRHGAKSMGNLMVTFTGPPTEEWKRIGPFRKKGWQKRGHAWSWWRPDFSRSRGLWRLGPEWSSSSVSTFGHNYTASTAKDFELLATSRTGERHIVGRTDITPEQIAEYRAAGEAVPGD